MRHLTMLLPCILTPRRTAQFFLAEQITSTIPSTIQKQVADLASSNARLSDTCATESESGSRPHFLMIRERIAISVEYDLTLKVQS